MKKIFLLLILLIIMIPSTSLAFPDTVRHGYTHCAACHVSPAGGGLLNGYGRSLSKELLSTWGYQGEEKIGHGLFSQLEKSGRKIHFGGDIRYLNRNSKTPTSKTDEGFLMQAQLKFALELEKFKLFINLGEIKNPRQSSDIEWVSPEYYLMYSPEANFHIRAGRFNPIYGLRLPEHNLLVKQEVGFVPWQRRDAVETLFQGESQLITLAGFQSLDSVSPMLQSTGYIASFYQTVFERYRLGVNFLNAEGPNQRRRSTTLSAVLPWTETLFMSVELSGVGVNGTESRVGFLRVSNELAKGFIPFVQIQEKQVPSNGAMDRSRYGIGFQWLPRPHWEFLFSHEKVEQKSGSSNESFLMSHYYF